MVDHNMKMLDSGNTLQACPVPEPDDILGLETAAERLVNVVVDLLALFRGEVTSRGIIFELKFDPHHQMDDICVDPVWPVIVKNPDVGCCVHKSLHVSEWTTYNDVPGFENGGPEGVRSVHRNRCFMTKSMMDPHSPLIFAVYCKYFRSSAGSRWNKSIRFVLMVSLTSFHVRRRYWLEGVERMRLSLSLIFAKNSGHSFSH